MLIICLAIVLGVLTKLEKNKKPLVILGYLLNFARNIRLFTLVIYRLFSAKSRSFYMPNWLKFPVRYVLIWLTLTMFVSALIGAVQNAKNKDQNTQANYTQMIGDQDILLVHYRYVKEMSSKR